MSGYVIYLSSNTSKNMMHESYGYWRGETYLMQGETFPITDGEVTKDTKVYKSKKRAENSAEIVIAKCGHVLSWHVEEI